VANIASRELRNDTAGVLRRVKEGEEVVITVNGEPVAQLISMPERRSFFLSRDQFLQRLATAQADPALRDDLDRLAGDSTDDLGPIR
jgi:prevent-host-death family protein